MNARTGSPTCVTLALSAAAILFLPLSAGAADLFEATRLFRTGKYAECIDYTAKAIADETFNENYRLLKIRAELETGLYADALKSWEDASQRFPFSLQLRWLGRTVLRFNGQDEQAARRESGSSRKAVSARESWAPGSARLLPRPI